MQVTSLLAEYAAFAVMLGLSVIIGLYYGCVKGEQNTVKEYLLGSKHMSVFPIAVSLIARYYAVGTQSGAGFNGSFSRKVPRPVYVLSEGPA